jgi:hypothetical protein
MLRKINGKGLKIIVGLKEQKATKTAVDKQMLSNPQDKFLHNFNPFQPSVKTSRLVGSPIKRRLVKTGYASEV